MAIFKSNTMTSASGSVGGTTYSHNRSGQYMRARRIPTNPNSDAQQSVRANFSSFSAAWRDLSSADQANWGVYAAATPRKNALGDTIFLTAQQMYVACNSLAAQLGLVIATPPATPGTVPLGPDLDVTVPANDTVTIAGIAGSLFKTAGSKIGVYVGRQVSNGVAFYKTPYQLTAVETGATGTATSINITIGGYNGSVIVDSMQLPLRIAGIAPDGRLSTVKEVLLKPGPF